MPSWPSALKPEAKLFGWTNLGSSLLYQLFSRHCAEESAAPGVRICVRYAGRLLDVIIDEHADGWIANHTPYACYRLLINLTIILLYLFICSVYAQPNVLLPQELMWKSQRSTARWVPEFHRPPAARSSLWTIWGWLEGFSWWIIVALFFVLCRLTTGTNK
jgi:hypothetical protein